MKKLFNPCVRATPTKLMRWPSTSSQALTQLPILAAPSVVAASTLPALYENYRAAPPNDNLGLFLVLLLAKRLTLYSCAATTVRVAALRSSDSPPGLGQRLEQLTDEALHPFEYPEEEKSELKVVVQTLDGTSDATQAATLPLLFGLLLVSAYAFNVLIGAPPPPSADADSAELANALRSAFINYAQPLSTASVCLFALNAEV